MDINMSLEIIIRRLINNKGQIFSLVKILY